MYTLYIMHIVSRVYQVPKAKLAYVDLLTVQFITLFIAIMHMLCIEFMVIPWFADN